MNILQSMIQSLQKEEQRFFKIYISRVNHGEDRKDIALFDMYKEQKELFDEEVASNILYGKKDKNSYYRLKNRLQTELNKSLILQHIEDDEFKIQFYYSLYKLFEIKKLKCQR